MLVRRLLLPLALLPLFANAQNIHGPRLGMSLATQSVGGLFQNTSNLLPGAIVGYGIELPMHPQFIIMPELLWMKKGAVVRNQAQLTKTRTSLYYLELPVLIKVSTDPKPGGLFFTIGPSVGYFLSGNYTSWYNGEKRDDYKVTGTGADSRFQVSAALGMGTDMRKTSFEFRAQTSLTPFSATLETQNIVYQLVFAWRITPEPKEAQGN